MTHLQFSPTSLKAKSHGSQEQVRGIQHRETTHPPARLNVRTTSSLMADTMLVDHGQERTGNSYLSFEAFSIP